MTDASGGKCIGISTPSCLKVTSNFLRHPPPCLPLPASPNLSQSPVVHLKEVVSPHSVTMPRTFTVALAALAVREGMLAKFRLS